MKQSGRNELRGLSLRDLALLFLDLGRLVLWCLLAGLVGLGSGCCAGRFNPLDWMSANPAPRLTLLAELKLRRQVARGLGELTAYLEEDASREAGHRPRPDHVGRRSPRHGWQRDGSHRPRHPR
ncbi:MAG: hypothetical protein QOF53_2878 [Nocardioidaceae bacterium]|jgi:hypothetical protein|nr:hypothetical protein [Nocardioidaceae bacterium]